MSYEALELASYELLARVADRAGERDVVETARRIAADERAMLERLEGLFDEAVNASLEDTERSDLTDKLRSYLADAHALEQQGEALLKRAASTPATELEHALRATTSRRRASTPRLIDDAARGPRAASPRC